MDDIRSMQAVRDYAIQAQMRYRMRLWALNGAASLSDNSTMHAEDGSLAARAIATYREQSRRGRGRRRSLRGAGGGRRGL